MSARGLLGGVGVAVVLALSGAIAFAGLATIVGSHVALLCLVAGLGGLYVIHQLRRAEDRVGRIAVFAAWLGITLTVALVSPGLPAALITQTLLISTVRTLYHHGSVLTGLADLGLSLFALSAALWASSETGSFFLSAWSYFLVQALYVAIPNRFNSPASLPGGRAGEDAFARAERTADAAVRRLATLRS